MNNCEISEAENYVSEISRSTRKRRSSLFHHIPRKIEDMTIDVDEDEADEIREKNKVGSEFAASSEAFDLPAYIEKLKNERKEWKETLNARKTRRRNLQKELATIQKKGADFDLSLLSESERSFLLERPDYQRISKNIKTLTEAAVKVAILNREQKVLHDRLILKIEGKLKNATRKIIAMSTEI